MLLQAAWRSWLRAWMAPVSTETWGAGAAVATTAKRATEKSLIKCILIQVRSREVEVDIDKIVCSIFLLSLLLLALD
mgnify:CR=1 FL=1